MISFIVFQLVYFFGLKYGMKEIARYESQKNNSDII
jgi:hypothetical protein